MTWRNICTYNSLPSCLSFRLSNNQLWRVTCHGNVPLLLSVFWPLLHPAFRLAPVDGHCFQRVPKGNILLMSQLNKYGIPEHTHTHTCSSSSSPAACAVGGGPNVLVVLIPSDIKRYLKEYKENREPALCIATMKLPPIWESGSVWTLWMSGDKMKTYMHQRDIVDVSRLIENMHRENLKLFFLPSTLSPSSSPNKLSIRFCEWICKFPTWIRRYFFDILSARITWRNICIIPCPLVFLSDFPTCHMSWQRASAAFFLLASSASCIETVASVDGLCLQSVPRDNTLHMSQPNK